MSRHRKLLTTLLAVVAAAGAANAGLACGVHGATPEHPRTTHHGARPAHAVPTVLVKKSVAPVPPPRVPRWRILESGATGRSFVIGVDQTISSAGCPAGASVTTSETATTIRVQVTEKYVRAQACADAVVLFLIEVGLRSPINGREIRGTGLFWPTAGVLYLTTTVDHNWIEVNRAPRVIGLASDQAIQLLRGQQFRGELIHRAGAAITAQSPGRRQLPPDSDPSHQFFGTIKLTAGT